MHISFSSFLSSFLTFDGCINHHSLALTLVYYVTAEKCCSQCAQGDLAHLQKHQTGEEGQCFQGQDSPKKIPPGHIFVSGFIPRVSFENFLLKNDRHYTHGYCCHSSSESPTHKMTRQNAICFKLMIHLLMMTITI